MPLGPIDPTGTLTGVLVNAIALAGRRASQAAAARRHRDDLQIARWFDTYQLTAKPPDGVPVDLLRADEVQAALQVLLAVRVSFRSSATGQPAGSTSSPRA